MDRVNHSGKIYTLLKPPTVEDPYLHSNRHHRLISYFAEKGNACHSVNTEGDVDFYILLASNEEEEDFNVNSEEYHLQLISEDKNLLRITYEEEDISASFRFKLDDPIDYHSLKRLSDKHTLDIYFITLYDEDYVCFGMKSVEIPEMFRYDLQRSMAGKKNLLLPAFSDKYFSDQNITEETLLRAGWGFYLDYTGLVNRLGNMEDAEEIVSRHILHGLTRLQRSRVQKGRDEVILLWVGRKIALSKEQLPIEYYSIYLTGEYCKKEESREPARRFLEESLKELPEFAHTSWVYPLEEEGVPLVAACNNRLYRVELTDTFYNLSSRLFEENYLPHADYRSYYHKIMTAHKSGRLTSKIYNLAAKRAEKKKTQEDIFSSQELLNMIHKGEDKNLPQIFASLKSMDPCELDDIVVELCQIFRGKLEPFFIPLLTIDDNNLKDVAIMGLGIIESKKAIPFLVDELRNSRHSANLAKFSLALIGDVAYTFVLPLLADRRAEVRIRAIETLGLLGSEQALAAIRQMKPDRSARVEAVKKRIVNQYKNP